METFAELMERIGAKPVDPEVLRRFEEAVRERVIKPGEIYRREQARLIAEARKRIVLALSP